MGMGSTNVRRRYKVTSSLIGWAHAQNDLYDFSHLRDFHVAVVQEINDVTKHIHSALGDCLTQVVVDGQECARAIHLSPGSNHDPAGTLRNNDVVIKSKRRLFDVITSKWRRFDVITTNLSFYRDIQFHHFFRGLTCSTALSVLTLFVLNVF